MELIVIGGENKEELERKSVVKKNPKRQEKMKGFMESMFGGQENLLYQERITRKLQ